MDIKYIVTRTHLYFYRESNTSFASNDPDDDKSYSTQNIADLVKKRLDTMMANQDNIGVGLSVTFEADTQQ